ncbi:MAG: hypothetical protein COA69_07120 [Robiginitomaculum sp.]|nr:MAG: hypothetical protein COA69_07120 [Robiginitomaculum sp.]
MKTSLSIGCALLLLLVIIEAVSPAAQSVLPIGNSDIAQTGVVLGICVVFSQMFEVTKELWHGRKK